MITLYVSSPDLQPLTQIFGVLDFTTSSKINNYDEVTFSIDKSNAAVDYEYLKEYNRVTVCNDYDGISQEYMRGCIKSVSISPEAVTVYIRGLERLLDKKIILSDATYTSYTVANIVLNFINEMNGRDATGITLHPDCSTTVIPEFKVTAKSTVLQALKALTKRGQNFKIIDNMLIVAEEIGDDLSSGPDIQLFKRDETDPADRNIGDRLIAYDADTIANAVIEKSVGTFTQDNPSISEFGRIEENILIDGDITAGLALELNKLKSSKKQVNVTPQVSDYFFAEVGDKVRIEINDETNLGYYVGFAYVVEKSISQGDSEVVTAKFSTATVYTKTLLENISEYDDRISRLELE